MQGLAHGPHGTIPDRYPVFSKPIYNMNGMGTGSRLVTDEQEYLNAIDPGHFWMPLFKGRHVSSDVALEKGRPRWWQHATGVPRELGTFDYWTYCAYMRTLTSRSKSTCPTGLRII